MSDTGSEESNDMIMNHPDIEAIDQKREQKKEGKLKDVVDILLDKELCLQLKLEEMRIAEEERKKNKEAKIKAKDDKLKELLFLRQQKREQKEIAEQEKLKRLEERKIAREENKAQRQTIRQNRNEEKRLAEEEAQAKRKEKALKSMKYLLSVSEKYLDFVKDKIAVDTKTTSKPLMEKNKFQPTLNDMKAAVGSGTEKNSKTGSVDIRKKMKLFEGGSLREYQIEGVQWMVGLFDNGINGILADEMGLGKTIQVIALICHLLEKNIPGPFLIVVPLSTLPNWESEFARFAPKVPVVVFHGSRHERLEAYKNIKKKYPLGKIKTHPVVLTSYQMPLLETKFLSSFEWQYLIIDEGHKIKNHECKLSQILRSFTSGNRLLLTGTPLQNNITELWSLLNFLMPHIFNNMETFATLVMLEDVQDENKLIEQEEKNNIISTLHRVLKPFMLRRLKKDVLTDIVPKKEVNVFCPLSKLQKDLYSYVLERNLAQLTQFPGKNEDVETEDILDQPRRKRKCVRRDSFSYVEKTENDDFDDYDEELIRKEEELIGCKIDKTRAPFITRLTMTNTIMMFRKIVDHPYLVHFPLDPDSEEKQLLVDENLIQHSGKMMVLDAMLSKLKEGGHKVLIFSNLVMTLDLIEDFMIMRGHTYHRLDGSLRLEFRGQNVAEFNKDPNIFAFLISTRAGGLGLNLVGADTVIFFDRDWNPQADIQAQDRCHRIGQTKPVLVYTLVTRNTIDEKIISVGFQKRLLEKLVIKDGKFQQLKSDDKAKAESELRELQELLRKESDSVRGQGFSEKELDTLLDRTELYKIMKESKFKK